MSASLHPIRRLGLPRRAARVDAPAWPLHGPGSVFAKGMRDSRRAWLAAGLGFGLVMFAYGMSMATNYPTVASRHEAIAATEAIAAIGSMTGPAINAERLGGFLSWRLGNLIPLLLGAWSIVALSGTLAGEIRSGSFEVLAGTPRSRRRIALEKVAVHLCGLAVAAALIGLLTWLAAVAFARLPGDDINLADALVHAGAMALCGLVAGAVAFAAAPWLGRGASAGIGALALVGAYLAWSYGGTVDALGAVRGLSWFTWTANERPIAGSWDHASLLPVAVLVVALLAAGVAAFERRDLGATLRLPSLRVPGRRFLLRGPARAAFLVGGPVAIAWGVALALYAWLVGISAQGYVDQFAGNAEAIRLMDAVMPGLDWQTTGGMLQILFFDIGLPFMGLAAATLVSVAASDERGRRLDLLLSTRVARARWVLATAGGLGAALAVLTVVVAIAAGLGAAQSGGDAVRPFVGVLVGGLYAAAIGGVGLAVFGLGGPALAATTTAVLAVGITLFEVVGAAVRLPAALLDVSLTRHLGAPMAGSYDGPGMVVAATLAIGGTLVGAWGLRRRDIST